MGLKTRFMYQNLIVLLATVLITAGISTAFSYFFGQIDQTSMDSVSYNTRTIVLKNNALLYADSVFSDVSVKDILLSVQMNEREYQHNGDRYAIDVQHFAEGASGYTVVNLNPVVDIQSYYGSMLLSIFITFLVVFVVASMVAQIYNSEHVISPIVALTREAKRLSHGDLERGVIDEGEGEVRDLCIAMEHLRLKLKDSVYYQEKYDDNRKFLVSSISHDLKTPVTAIRGYIEGVLDGVAATPEKQRQYLSLAVRKTELITAMIDDLLLYSKLDLHQISFHLEQIALVDYIQFLFEDFQYGFQSEGKQLRLENQAGDVTISVDRERFARVLQNVLDNAKKYVAPDRGVVTIKLRRGKHSAIIEVADNGKGIAKEDLPHIFDRFYRADAARPMVGSSGLGLAIAKQIVEGCGGRIWAVSDGKSGTSIMMSFPAAEPKDEEETHQ